MINFSISGTELKLVQFWLIFCPNLVTMTTLWLLEVLDSIFEFADPQNPTISAKKSTISCAEMKSAILAFFAQIWLPW